MPGKILAHTLPYIPINEIIIYSIPLFPEGLNSMTVLKSTNIWQFLLRLAVDPIYGWSNSKFTFVLGQTLNYILENFNRTLNKKQSQLYQFH